MFNYIWPLLIIIFSNTLYQICAKGIPEQMNTYASMTITYAVATFFSALAFFVTTKGGNIIKEFSHINWATIVLGIVMKVFGIVVSIVIGISLGGQPIIGFNMGAGNMERVNETIRTITKIVLAIGTVFFLIFELAPDFVISLFGKNNSPEYTEYARLCVRIFLSGIIITCFIKSAAIMLQSLGKSGKSTLLALLRDVIVFVPSSIILALTSHNIVTMLWASLISDVISFIFAVIFLKGRK